MNPRLSVVLVIALIFSMTHAAVTNAKTGADLQTFSAANIKNSHTYGLYFTDKDEGFFATIKGIFTSDKEAEFKNMLVDSDQMSLLNINVKDPQLKDYATQMGITQFPYIVVYFNGDRDHNIHGVANKETATQILNELQRIQPKPVSIPQVKKDPVNVGPANIPPEAKDAHDNHGSPSAALEARPQPTPQRPTAQPPRPVGDQQPARAPAPQPIPVPRPTPAQPVMFPPQPQPQPQPQPIPAPTPAQPSIPLRPKQVGDFVHESPRHEPGYIEDVDQDDLLPGNAWARQVLSALPDIVYDIYPEPQPVTPREEVQVQYVVPRPEVVVERPFIAPTFAAPAFAPPVVERVAPTFAAPAFAAPVVERVAPVAPISPVRPAFAAPTTFAGPVWPAPVASKQNQPTAAKSTSTTTKPAQTAAPTQTKQAATTKPLGSTTEKLAAQKSGKKNY